MELLTFEVEGEIVGPLNLADPAVWGSLRLEPDGRFAVSVEPAGRPLADLVTLVPVVPLAVAAAVVAARGVAVQVRVRGYSWTTPEGRHHPREATVSLAYRVTPSADPDIDVKGQTVHDAVLLGADQRLARLYEVYLLGVRALQTIEPVCGLWAFTKIIEEDGGGATLTHARSLAADLRAAGYTVRPDPDREPARIRAAAVHPTPKDPAPTLEEIDWLRQVAHAYLLRRAGYLQDRSAQK